MKYLIRFVLLNLFLLVGGGTFASHILGAEIFYKHVKDNQYLATVNIYRDCNGCKINGTGGGLSSENCSEIDFIYVKGSDHSGYKETKFALERQKIVDVSPVCKTKFSVCNSKSNSAFGIELQQFTSLVDLDHSSIKGFCNYQLYVSISERNSNITTGQAKQNFCVDAFIQTCLANNNSADFSSLPTFILNSNKIQYQSYFAFDKDEDSLVYNFCPALTKIDKEVNYGSKFSFDSPISTFCLGTPPCAADKIKLTGFYLDKYTGNAQFIPVTDGEIGIVAVRVDEYRKISGKWELIGYIKRDIQVYVKSSDGNNSPKFLNQDYFEVCEGEQLNIKFEAEDAKLSSSSAFDSVRFHLNAKLEGSSFSEISQSTEPYNYAMFSWIPKKGTSSKGVYHISVTASDNYCPFNALSSQTITIKVKPKETFKLFTTDLSCGNFEVKTSSINAKSKLEITIKNQLEHLVFKTVKTIDTVSFLPQGTYIIEAVLTAENGCKSLISDTFSHVSSASYFDLTGETEVCKLADYTYEAKNLPSVNCQLDWKLNGGTLTSNNPQTISFETNSLLTVFMSSTFGKWLCKDTITKVIQVIKMPEINAKSPLEACHNSGLFDLNSIEIYPEGGVWSSTDAAFKSNQIKTDGSSAFDNDTLLLTYSILNQGCKESKTFNFVLKAIPEFKLSSSTVCEVKTPIVMYNLVQKPYQITKYTVNFDFPLSPGMVKLENGTYVFYPTDLGFGMHTYYGAIKASNGCSNFDTATIEITPVVNISFQNSINLCQGSGLQDINEISGVKPNNGSWSFYTFDLIRDRKFASTDSCGTFELTYIYDNYGCYDSKKISVNIACKPKMDIVGLPDEVCETQLPLTLTSNLPGGMWDGQFVTGNSFNPLGSQKPEKYTVNYIYKAAACNFKTSKNIVVNPSPKLNVYLDKDNICHNQFITLSGSVKNTNSITFKNLGNTLKLSLNGSSDYLSERLFMSKFNPASDLQNLEIEAENSYGCKKSASLPFRVFDTPKIAWINDTTLCEGSGYLLQPKITYGGVDVLKYSWINSNGQFDNKDNLSCDLLTVGRHPLIFRAENDFCSDSKSLVVTINPKPFVDFVIQPSSVTTIKQPTFTFFNQSNLNLDWYWDFGTNYADNFNTEANPTYSYRDTGTYEVSLTGTNEFGCSDTRKRTLIVRPDLLIFIPNAFSPNHKDEEKNNVFGVSLQNYTSYSMEIFDRWGHKLFSSENPEETWDGTADGNNCTPDIYLYTIKITSITNQNYHYKGTITLIK